jgi:hypothetical protein
MLQPCRAGQQLSIDPPLSSGNKKYIIPPPTKNPRRTSIDRQSRDGRGERVRMRIERKVVRPAITRHSAKIALECVRVDQNSRSLFQMFIRPRWQRTYTATPAFTKTLPFLHTDLIPAGATAGIS